MKNNFSLSLNFPHSSRRSTWKTHLMLMFKLSLCVWRNAKSMLRWNCIGCCFSFEEKKLVNAAGNIWFPETKQMQNNLSIFDWLRRREVQGRNEERKRVEGIRGIAIKSVYLRATNTSTIVYPFLVDCKQLRLPHIVILSNNCVI